MVLNIYDFLNISAFFSKSFHKTDVIENAKKKKYELIPSIIYVLVIFESYYFQCKLHRLNESASYNGKGHLYSSREPVLNNRATKCQKNPNHKISAYGGTVAERLKIYHICDPFVGQSSAIKFNRKRAHVSCCRHFSARALN